MKALCLALFLSTLFIQAWSFDPNFKPEWYDILQGYEPEPEYVGDLTPYLTSDFNTWLNDNGYGSFNFQRTDIAGGSFGGKSSKTEKITKKPIIFFHGNSDKAMGNETDQFNGWTDSLNYFMSQGYKESELYVTTWGPANPMLATQQYHSYTYLNYLRKFVEAVLNYTKAEKIDVISHSMGVTLARKVIKGGTGSDSGNSYDLGSSLADKVDVFIGISGANYGLVNCEFTYVLPTCGQVNGFYPGLSAGYGLSTFLNDLNTNGDKEGSYVATMLSTVDDLIMYGDMVFGRYTSQFPTEDDSVIYNNLTHMQMKATTYAEQYKIITEKQI